MFNIIKQLVGIIILFVATTTLALPERHFPPGTQDVFIPDVKGVRQSLLHNIAPIIESSIEKGFYPGAVVLASHKGRIIYRGVFGNRRIVPDVAPMKFDTIFDIASLTKVLVITTAIMQLVESGKLDLDLPVARYWPAFANNGKEQVTSRELLTHTSGFAPDVAFCKEDQLPDYSEQGVIRYGEYAAFRAVEKQKLINTPGTVFLYSDANFVALGHLVEIISKTKLDDYASKNIFEPLHMHNTFYLPPKELRDQIAPTEIVHGVLRWGEVHDDTVRLMGGVAGMAGVFSTAEDLGRFADCLLNDGRIKPSNRHLLGPLAITKMTSRQTPLAMKDVHGLGWDIDSKYSNRGILFSVNSFGHTGWTGTSLWIDPTTKTWLIILTSRTHPTPMPFNPLISDRKAIANIIAGSLVDVPKTSKAMKNTGVGELSRAYPAQEH